MRSVNGTSRFIIPFAFQIDKQLWLNFATTTTTEQCELIGFDQGEINAHTIFAISDADRK